MGLPFVSDQDEPTRTFTANEISAIVERIFGDRRPAEAKMALSGVLGSEYRSFFVAYPTLFKMACRATPAQRPAIRQQLSFMLDKLKPGNNEDRETTARSVHAMLTEKYINPVVETLAVSTDTTAQNQS